MLSWSLPSSPQPQANNSLIRWVTNKQITKLVNVSGSIKGANSPSPVGGSAPPPLPQRKKWSKSTIFSKFLDFCPLEALLQKVSGVATGEHHGDTKLEFVIQPKTISRKLVDQVVSYFVKMGPNSLGSRNSESQDILILCTVRIKKFARGKILVRICISILTKILVSRVVSFQVNSLKRKCEIHKLGYSRLGH